MCGAWNLITTLLQCHQARITYRCTPPLLLHCTTRHRDQEELFNSKLDQPPVPSKSSPSADTERIQKDLRVIKLFIISIAMPQGRSGPLLCWALHRKNKRPSLSHSVYLNRQRRVRKTGPKREVQSSMDGCHCLHSILG